MTTPEENKAMFRRFIDEVWNNGNLAVADELFAPDAFTPSAPQLPPGPEGVKVIATLWRTAFPDFHMTIEDLIAEEDKVVARFTETGTHQGEFMGIAPTGRRISITEIGILRLVNNKVAESWYEVDMLSLMQQLGVLPPREESTAINNIEQESIMANDIIEQNRQIGQNFFNFLMRGGDPNEVFSPDFVYHDAQGVSHDLAGTMALIQPILVAIPDRAVEVEEEIITNDRVVLRWRRSGSFQNDAWGVHATGTRFNDVGVTILGIGANNKIAEIWEFVDFLNFFTQIGAIRELVANMGSGQSAS